MNIGKTDEFLSRMERALDVISQRQQLTASNIANLDTPRYRTLDIDFNGALKQAVSNESAAELPRVADERHIGGGTRTVTRPEEVRGLITRVDGNNVNLDREMMSLAEARLRYESVTSMLRIKLRQLRSVINEGRAG